MSKQDKSPLIPASQSLPELTLKVIILSIVLAAVLAASNAYLALKIGTTISASIPASVLALGILRFFKNSNVLESNIVQTAASAGEGIASAIAYILPAMIILGIWRYFPYWETVLLTLLGGLLGVLFSIPLRRVLLSMPTLRFPEGTAIGNVLRYSTKGGSHVKSLSFGGLAGALVSLGQTGFKLIADSLQAWFSTGSTLFGIGLGFTPATLAAGYIVGIEVAFSLLAGVIIGWVVLIPLLSHYYGVQLGVSSYDQVMLIWSKHLRFVGVGTMLVGGIWTLSRLLKPVISGLKLSFSTLQKFGDNKKKVPRTELDLPIHWMLGGTIILTILLFFYLRYAMHESGLLYGSHFLLFVDFLTVIFIVVVGFLMATICGYFTGLVGSSNNPLSGMLIISLLLLGGVYFILFDIDKTFAHGNVAALMVLVVTVVSAIAAISNENIQDLKAGQMVGATPWKQQFILSIGVVVSALFIGPVLELLFNAYGIGGVFPRPGMDPAQMLAAPQSSLMAAVALGLRGHHALPWNMVYLGCGVAVLTILMDEYLRVKKNRRLPTLAVGLGIYIPPAVMLPVFIGGLMNYLVKRSVKKAKKVDPAVVQEKQQRGILVACGLVAGNAVMGVFLAIPFVFLGSSNALSIVPAWFHPIAVVLGFLTLVGLSYWLYAASRVK